MLEDTFEGLEEDDVEEAADAEVEKILWEVTSGEQSLTLFGYTRVPFLRSMYNVCLILQVSNCTPWAFLCPNRVALIVHTHLCRYLLIQNLTLKNALCEHTALS